MTEPAMRYLHQCPGCWGYGLFRRPFNKRKGEGWIECECGEKMTRIDLRDPEPADLIEVVRLASALDNVDRDYERGWTPAHYARAIAAEYERLAAAPPKNRGL